MKQLTTILFLPCLLLLGLLVRVAYHPDATLERDLSTIGTRPLFAYMNAEKDTEPTPIISWDSATATWYGLDEIRKNPHVRTRFHEKFDPYEMTCAVPQTARYWVYENGKKHHLEGGKPLWKYWHNDWLLVYNVENGKSIKVRVNDTGAFGREKTVGKRHNGYGRSQTIDLTFAAFNKLSNTQDRGMLNIIVTKIGHRDSLGVDHFYF